MKRIKTIVSFLCAAALALTLLVMPSSASGGLFFLSLNDTLPAQSVQMTPVQYSGWVYVPVNVFNSQSTGVNFGLYYGLTENNTKLVLYNLSGKTMTFRMGPPRRWGERPLSQGRFCGRTGCTTSPPMRSAGILA